jgi:hypothetical protein
MSDEHMSDKDLEVVLREWTQDAPAGQPDRSRVVGSVVGQLGSTRRRRRRWWAFPWRNRKPDEPAAIDKTQNQPSPIPASNGHTPTVIGRTSSMLSPVKAITAGAIVFAIGGVMLIAQPFQQQGTVPGAELSEPAEAVEFTARFPWGPQVGTGTSEVLDSGVTEQVDWAHQTRSVDSSDQRFEGEMVYTCNSHEYPEAQGRLFDCVFRVETDAGAWQSRPSLQVDFGDAAYGPFSVFTTTFDGEGDYEGLTAVVEMAEISGEGYHAHGVIVDGYLPPNAEHFGSE